MQFPPNIIERAFELAGQCGSIDEVRHKLKAEGYFQVDAHLAGPTLRSDLMRRLEPQLMRARKKSGPAGGKVGRFPRERRIPAP